jgi:hypothetical protein
VTPKVEPVEVPEDSFVQPEETPVELPETPVLSTDSEVTEVEEQTSGQATGGVAGGVEGGVVGGEIGGVQGGIVGGEIGGVVGGEIGGEQGGVLGGVVGGQGTGPGSGTGEGSGDAPSGPLRVGGNVKAPTVITRVEPDYTEVARKGRVQGIVIVEAVIDSSGNVDRGGGERRETVEVQAGHVEWTSRGRHLQPHRQLQAG